MFLCVPCKIMKKNRKDLTGWLVNRHWYRLNNLSLVREHRFWFFFFYFPGESVPDFPLPTGGQGNVSSRPHNTHTCRIFRGRGGEEGEWQKEINSYDTWCVFLSQSVMWLLYMVSSLYSPLGLLRYEIPAYTYSHLLLYIRKCFISLNDTEQ